MVMLVFILIQVLYIWIRTEKIYHRILRFFIFKDYSRSTLLDKNFCVLLIIIRVNDETLRKRAREELERTGLEASRLVDVGLVQRYHSKGVEKYGRI